MLQVIITFLDMNGYGYYIWGSYGLSALLLICLLAQSKYSLKTSQAKLKELQEKHPR